ncbi:MAG: hypothetical protein JSV82_08700 [Planctomycetota bacterium]|nr:MAG: hypothetical protein JSV82_08700 [Planctomycetota bacterium]
MTYLPQLHTKLERITRKWWFFLLFVLLQFTVPPYASKGYNFPDEWAEVIKHALRNPIVYSYSELYPIFKVIPIILVIGIIVFRNKVSRLFSIYVSLSYVLFAFGQSIGVTEKYGLVICTLNLTMFLIVAGFWIWEAIVLQNDFVPAKLFIWRYWVVPLAFLAFWYPINLRTGRPDFNPIYLFTNIAGMAFCTMTPFYVGLLTLYWPKVNMATLRVTSLVGFIIGLYNMHLNFIVRPGILWWNGVLHIPLLAISLYGLILSLKKPKYET